MDPSPSERQTEDTRSVTKKAMLSPATLLLSAALGLMLFLFFLPGRKSRSDMGKVVHAAAHSDRSGALLGERSTAAERARPNLASQKPAGTLPLPPPGGVDAFGLPATGAFETGSARSSDPPLALSSLAAYLPIWGYLEGQEVIIGGRVYHAGEPLAIRTPSGLCKARIVQVDRHCLVLRDEEGTEVRVPWPRTTEGSGIPSNEIFIDPSSQR